MKTGEDIYELLLKSDEIDLEYCLKSIADYESTGKAYSAAGG